MNNCLGQRQNVRTAVRITEEPSLYGLLVREHGEVIEYVSYHEARLRVESGRPSAIGPPLRRRNRRCGPPRTAGGTLAAPLRRSCAGTPLASEP